MKDRSRIVIGMVTDVLIILFTVLSIATIFAGVSVEFGGSLDECFNFFTTDSNIYVAITAVISLIFSAKKLRNIDYKVPTWVTVLKLTSTVAVTLTFLTTALFLGPTFSMNSGTIATYFWLFSGNIYYLHFATPAIAIIGFIFYNSGESIKGRYLFFGLLPVIVYGTVYVYAVLILKAWNDFYGFTFGGHYEVVPVVILVMAAAVILISFAEWKAREVVLVRLNCLTCLKRAKNTEIE